MKLLSITDSDILTLSDGRYDEFHDYNDFERVGSAIIDMRTRKIARFVNKDSVVNETDMTTRFLTVDPMAEKYYQLSPYVYCHNNPINMIDPNGLTDYMVNNQGVIYKKNPIIDEIKKFFGIADKDDKLISTNKNNSTLVLDAGSIGEIETQNDANGKPAGHSFSVSNDKAEQVFEFLSENTDVEWSNTEYKNSEMAENIISTSHDHEKEQVGSLILDDLLSKGKDVIGYDHSHPDGGPPSGYRPESRNTNDKDVVKYMNKYHPGNNIIYRAYDVSKKGYWIYDVNKIIGFQNKRK